MAERIKKTEFFGIGAVIQLIGILFPIVGYFMFQGKGLFIGVIFGIILFFYGSHRSHVWKCGGCGNKLADKSVRMCPVCKAEFS